jgi:hypothetical protein
MRLSRHGELRKGIRADRGSAYAFELKPKDIIDAIQVDQCSWQVDEKPTTLQIEFGSVFPRNQVAAKRTTQSSRLLALFPCAYAKVGARAERTSLSYRF